MNYIFLTSLALILLIFILISKELISTLSKMSSIKKELKKYEPKNKYQIRKIISSINQSKKIIKNTTSAEEKIHWYGILISSYVKLKGHTTKVVQNRIEAHENKYRKELEKIHNTLYNMNSNNFTNKIDSKKSSRDVA